MPLPRYGSKFIYSNFERYVKRVLYSLRLDVTTTVMKRHSVLETDWIPDTSVDEQYLPVFGPPYTSLGVMTGRTNRRCWSISPYKTRIKLRF